MGRRLTGLSEASVSKCPAGLGAGVDATAAGREGLSAARAAGVPTPEDASFGAAAACVLVTAVAACTSVVTAATASVLGAALSAAPASTAQRGPRTALKCRATSRTPSAVSGSACRAPTFSAVHGLRSSCAMYPTMSMPSDTLARAPPVSSVTRGQPSGSAGFAASAPSPACSDGARAPASGPSSHVAAGASTAT